MWRNLQNLACATDKSHKIWEVTEKRRSHNSKKGSTLLIKIAIHRQFSRNYMNSQTQIETDNQLIKTANPGPILQLWDNCNHPNLHYSTAIMMNSKQEINLKIWTLEPWVRLRNWVARHLSQEFSDWKQGVCCHYSLPTGLNWKQKHTSIPSWRLVCQLYWGYCSCLPSPGIRELKPKLWDSGRQLFSMSAFYLSWDEVAQTSGVLLHYLLSSGTLQALVQFSHPVLNNNILNLTIKINSLSFLPALSCRPQTEPKLCVSFGISSASTIHLLLAQREVTHILGRSNMIYFHAAL